MKKLMLASVVWCSLMGSTLAANVYGWSAPSPVRPWDAGDQIKMALAKQKLYSGQYLGALALYKEVLEKSPDSPVVLHYIGLCYYHLQDYQKATDAFQKAIQKLDAKNESHLILGKIYLNDGKIDEALTEFNLYASKASSKDIEFEDVKVYLAHCNNAKKYMQSPMDVTISNLGTAINSRYDDKTPSITADGRKLIFTTRRPETTDAPVDVEGDGKYFEDIYIATWDTIKRTWTPAESVPGAVNTDAHDACTSISPDGKQIFIYKNDLKDNTSRGGDIFVSKVVNGKWKTPEPMGKPVNTSYWEGGACISPDGKTLYFTSERKGGYGNSDIWMVKKIGKNEWGKPENLGPEVNTSYDEAGIFMAPDGKTLFFCSNGMESMGSYDILKTTFENGKWSKPVNLGYPINSEGRDGPLVLSADAQIAYIASDRKGGLGETDIYRVDLKEYAILEKDGKRKLNNGLSILRGTVRDSYEGTGLEGVEVTVSDPSGTIISSTFTNEAGDYFFTLKGDVTYTVSIKKKGYTTSSENVELKLGQNEPFTLDRQFMLNKEK